ncbi:GntR family transcriptional regulator [Blautia schinkii]|nr:GntR family transcriptional regulator [Blautia schinkii]
MYMDIDKNSQTPIYQQIIDLFTTQMLNGELVPGSRVPSESEMQERYGISRVTVRRAYSKLMEDGYLIRKQGKGTFIKGIHYSESLASTSFSATCRMLGFKPGSKVIKVGFTKATDLDVQKLKVKEGQKIAYMERLRFADGIPIRLERNYYAAAYCDIIKENMEQSVRALLKDKYGLTEVQQMHFTIEIGYADEEEAGLLGIKRKSPLLKVNGALYDMKEEPIYRTEMLHLPDRCVLVV